MQKNIILRFRRVKFTSLIFTLALLTIIFIPSVTKAAADSSLSFDPVSKTVSTGEAFTLDALVNPGSHHVSAVELFITYDQSKMSLTKIACSSDFGNVLFGPTISSPENGTARIDCGVSLGSSPTENQVVAATLSFNSLSEEADGAQVIFSDSSIVAADDELGVNELGTKDPASITIAKPKIKTYSVTPSSDKNGTISPNIPQTVNEKTSLQFVVSPKEGHSALVGGTCGGTLTGTIYTTKAITADCTVEVSFPKILTPPFNDNKKDGYNHFFHFRSFFPTFKKFLFEDTRHEFVDFFRFKFWR